MTSPMVHWEIRGQDLDALAESYRKLFGWEAESFDADYRLTSLVPRPETSVATD